MVAASAPEGWTLLFRQTAGNYRPVAEWVSYNVGDRSGDFSVLDTLEDYRQNGAFTLKLVWPDRAGANTQTWRQTSNPVTDSEQHGGVEGYEAIDVPFDTHHWSVCVRSMLVPALSC